MSGTGTKVVCLGLGRTGTLSLRSALETLGFGPCYHMVEVFAGPNPKAMETWSKIGDGKLSTEELREFLKDYNSFTDYPQAMYPEQMYAAYPDAKFILNVRDPEAWAQSMGKTILPMIEGLRAADGQLNTRNAAWLEWLETHFLVNFHHGRLFEHTADELTAHIEHVKRVIPPEKLFIYQLGDGWDGLVEWLGVPKPTVPYPHINDTESFQQLAVDMGVKPDA